jgi:hypothetical protein
MLIAAKKFPDSAAKKGFAITGCAREDDRGCYTFRKIEAFHDGVFERVSKADWRYAPACRLP